MLASSHSLTINGDECKWQYRCCKLIDNRCIEMCEAEIICDSYIEDMRFKPATVLNVKCKFGYKSDNTGNCRRVLRK